MSYENKPIIFHFNDPIAENTLYLDRDGVINKAVIRAKEISSPRNMKELKISNDLISLNSHNILKNWNLVIITNQPDLSRGLIDLNFVKKINKKINSILPINIVYVCPHIKEDRCLCRKPEIGMIHKFRTDNPKMIRSELFIGDRKSDLQCAINANIPFILRERTYNKNFYRSSYSIIHDLFSVEKYLTS